MQFYLKQRIFTWFDSFDIYHEDGSVAYTVQGQLSWGHKLEVLDAEGRYLGMVRERVMTFLPQFEMYQGDEYLGCIYREFTILRSRFTLDYQGWSLDGDILGWDYELRDMQGRTVATIAKELWRLGDTYVLDIERPEDAFYVVMAVLAIDCSRCRN
ncbi:MAG TPA: LURP-one-related family protein [Candidatus Avoscillospira avicola]|uniref:LURP-one-related family protein n=1 Tax=Candidatus Avoscillospira avicola TaxID=2840706 RepID=A0A9D1DIW5_9FIRM|nr:LURP-one-related family protein [Candidatus Avoscillospira avicola]